MSKDLKVGDEAHGHFLVTSARNDTTKNGKPYVSFDCRARDGAIFSGCKIWDCKDRPSGVIEILGPVEEFNGNVHIVAKRWRTTDIDPNEFEPRAPWPLDLKKMCTRLRVIFDEIYDGHVADFAEKYLAFWSSHTFPDLEKTKKRFMFHPGAKKVHHAYRHGLFEHTLEVTEHAIVIAKLHDLNSREKDLLIVGCLIHDLGKMEEFSVENAVYDYTLVGKAYGWSSNAHLYIGGQMLTLYYSKHKNYLEEEDFLVLQNIILSHHGEYADTKPKWIIAMIAHCADMASSQTNRMRMGLAATDADEVERDVVRQSYLRLDEYSGESEASDDDDDDGGDDDGGDGDSLTFDVEEAEPNLLLRLDYDAIHNEYLPEILDPPYY